MTITMIPIALITTRFVRQGPNKQLLYHIRNIDKTKFRPIIITISPEKTPSLLNEFQQEDVEIVQLNLSFMESIFWGRRKVQNVIKRNNVQIVHSFTYAIRADFLAYKLKKVYKIASIRNSPKQSSIGKYGDFFGAFFYFFRFQFYQRFHILAACSNSIYNLPELKRFNRISIQNGIDTSILNNHPLNYNKQELKAALNLRSDQLTYITISNGTALKNLKFLIKHFQEDTKRVLIIAGDYNEEYLKLSANNSKIIFVGHTDKIYNYYQAADFFVSASYWEGLPNAVLESLLLGTPCLLSDIEMHKEVLFDEESSIGRLFKNDDHDDLTIKMRELEKVFNKETPHLCSSFVVNNFSAQKMSKKYQELYKNLLSK